MLAYSVRTFSRTTSAPSTDFVMVPLLDAESGIARHCPAATRFDHETDRDQRERSEKLGLGLHGNSLCVMNGV
jgi:hypothetical protein